MTPLRLGTRGSTLARAQSAIVAAEIRRLFPQIQIETSIIKTTGDQITDRPLYESGGKGLFVKELELALLDNSIDFAVHSCKDLPVTMPLVDQSDLLIAAIPPREDPRDVLISPHAKRIGELQPAASVATGSLRRKCQLLSIRPDIQIRPIRGNIDTRIRKLKTGEYHALILATAGIIRAGLWDEAIMTPIGLDELLPAPGQGALALQCRASDEQTRSVLGAMDDAPSRRTVEAERAIVAGLHCDCHSPIAVYAVEVDTAMEIRAALGARDGSPPVRHAHERGHDAVPEIVRHLSP
jgi:hydroxymethylbilane synthase